MIISRQLPPLATLTAPHLIAPGVIHKLAGQPAEIALSCLRIESDHNPVWLGSCLVIRRPQGSILIEGIEIYDQQHSSHIAAALLDAAAEQARHHNSTLATYCRCPQPPLLYPSSPSWYGAGTADPITYDVAIARGARVEHAAVTLTLPARPNSTEHINLLPLGPAEESTYGLQRLRAISVSVGTSPSDLVTVCPDIGKEVSRTSTIPRSAQFVDRSAIVWRWAGPDSNLHTHLLRALDLVSNYGAVELLVTIPQDYEQTNYYLHCAGAVVHTDWYRLVMEV